MRAVMLLGRKHSGELYTTEDLDVLATIAKQAASASENTTKTSELRMTVRRAAEAYALVAENKRLTRKLSEANERLRGAVNVSRQNVLARYQFENLIGASLGMQAVQRLMQRAMRSDIPVLINGETGTGKELIAQAIHYAGPRCGALFVPQNCAAVPHELQESILFGHRKGSFSGATSDQKGLFEVADGGTIFLDEIGEMSPAMQAKLLRVLQEYEYTRVGDTARRRVNVRVISATNRNLAEEIRGGHFREDLYYRINAFEIAVPPLRIRRDDIPLLAKRFLSQWEQENGRRLNGISEEAMALLVEHNYPGNVRELQNEIRRAATLANDGEPIVSELLSDRMRRPLADRTGTDLRAAVREFERQFVSGVLARNQSNISQTARDLGLTRTGLQRKLKELNIAVER